MYLAPACSLWLFAGASILEFRAVSREKGGSVHAN